MIAVLTRPPERPTQIANYVEPSNVLHFGGDHGEIGSWRMPMEAADEDALWMEIFLLDM